MNFSRLPSSTLWSNKTLEKWWVRKYRNMETNERQYTLNVWSFGKKLRTERIINRKNQFSKQIVVLRKSKQSSICFFSRSLHFSAFSPHSVNHHTFSFSYQSPNRFGTFFSQFMLWLFLFYYTNFYQQFRHHRVTEHYQATASWLSSALTFVIGLRSG